MIIEEIDEGIQEPENGPLFACCWFVWWPYLL